MSIFEAIQMIGGNVLFFVAALLVALSILVFVHEWGHYIIARMCGVRVEIFSIGFGKEIWGRNDKHGTRWKVSLIPLGGYVKLFGDTDPASAGYTQDVKEGEEVRPMTQDERDVAFFAKPLWQRAAIVFAGPAINYIFAVILLAGIYVYMGQPVVQPIASGVIKGSSAYDAGFKPHDRIVSIDGVAVKDFSDIARQIAVSLDQPRVFKVLRGEDTIEIAAQPKRVENKDRFGFKNSSGLLGIVSPEQAILISQIEMINGEKISDAAKALEILKSSMGKELEISVRFKGSEKVDSYLIVADAKMNEALGTAENIEEEILLLARDSVKTFVAHNVFTATQSAINRTVDITVSSLQALGQIVTGTRSATELGGLPRIATVAGDMAQQGVLPFILFIAFLSINLGFINLLPIPLLDGGHLVFYACEGVLGRPIPDQMQEYAFRAGFVFLIGIMAFANINDLVQLSGVMG